MNHLGTITLKSDRLRLRRIYKEDAKEIYEGFVNQEDFLYYANKEKRTLKMQEQSLIGIDEKYKNLSYYNWLITLKENGKIIGSINAFFNYFEDEKDALMFNYAIDDRYKNNGYMSEALYLTIKFFLNEVNVKKIYCGCCIENIASKKVMEKNNMLFDKIIKNHIKLKDGYHDMLLYKIEK